MRRGGSRIGVGGALRPRGARSGRLATGSRPSFRGRAPDVRPASLIAEPSAGRRASGALAQGTDHPPRPARVALRMSEDAKTLIEQAVHQFLDEVPALKPMKLVLGVDLHGRGGDTQQFRVDLPDVAV